VSAPMIFSADYYARLRALEEGSWWHAALRDVAGGLLARARLPARGRAVDVGCGSGLTLAWFLAARPQWRAVGFDVSLAAARAAAATRPREVVAAAAAAIPLETASTDLVLCFDVLQHLPLAGGDRAALGEMRRVLRPGGALLLRTNAQSWPPLADDPEHEFRRYTPVDLRRKLAAEGFRVRRLGRVNALLGLAEIPRELRRRRDGGGYAGLLAELPRRGLGWRLKRAWLRGEGRLVALGASWPLGRTLLALAEASDDEAAA